MGGGEMTNNNNNANSNRNEAASDPGHDPGGGAVRRVTVSSQRRDRPDVRRLARALIALAAAHNADSKTADHGGPSASKATSSSSTSGQIDGEGGDGR